MARTPYDNIHLSAPTWLDQAFGSGVVGSLAIGGDLSQKILQNLDRLPEIRNCGLRIGVVGRATKHGPPIRASAFIRAANNPQQTTALVYIGPKLSEPPIVPSVSATHQLIAELFSTTLTCSLAVAGWVGTIASVGASGATGGLSVVATTYLSAGASLATAQCLGSMVHSTLYVTNREKADALAENSAYKKFNTVSDAVNLAGIVFAGMDIFKARQVLRELGVSWADTVSGNVSVDKVLTMRKLFEILEPANAQTIARNLQVRILNATAAAFGIYGSQRDDNGVVNHLQVAVGAGAVKRSADDPAPVTPGQGAILAPRTLDERLRYEPNEVATVSVAMLKTPR